MSKIFTALESKDEDVRVTAMMTLVEVGRLEYDYVDFYKDKIFEITANAA
jgi:hypothetical protein